MADKNITGKLQMMAQKDITWKIQMVAQKDITWKIQMVLLKRETKENKKQKQRIEWHKTWRKRIEVLTSGEALRRMQTIFSNVKKTCTANESMRQNHLQIKAAHHLSNHQEHNNLDFPALWELELYLAFHNVCRCSIFFRENTFQSWIHVCLPQWRVTINCKFFMMASIEGIYQLLIVSYVLASGRDLVTPSWGSSESTLMNVCASGVRASIVLVSVSVFHYACVRLGARWVYSFQ